MALQEKSLPRLQVLRSSLTWKKRIPFVNSREISPQNGNLEGTTRKPQVLQHSSENFNHLSRVTNYNNPCTFHVSPDRQHLWEHRRKPFFYEALEWQTLESARSLLLSDEQSHLVVDFENRVWDCSLAERALNEGDSRGRRQKNEESRQHYQGSLEEEVFIVFFKKVEIHG